MFRFLVWFADILPTNCLALNDTEQHVQTRNDYRGKTRKYVTSYGIIQWDIRLLTFKKKDNEGLIAQLYQQIGQLKVERDF